MASWSDLPRDVLHVILTRLTHKNTNSIVDRHCFSEVCTSWQSVALEGTSSLPRQIPWLLLHPSNEIKESCFRFFDLSNKKICSLHVPNVHGLQYCCGSSQGWLLVVDENSPIISLTNPLIRARIEFPPATTLPSVLSYGLVRKNYYVRVSSRAKEPYSSDLFAQLWLRKIVLSLQPTLVMAMCNGYNRLVFCKPGDNTWTIIQDKECYYSDIAYCQGQFYAVDKQCRIVVCDLGPSPQVKQIESPGEVADGGVYHLVESSGELLLVCWRFRFFKVFKRDKITREWSKVESLDDYTLFLSPSSSFSLPWDYPDLQGNSIYYITNSNENLCGIYSLEDDSFTPFNAFLRYSQQLHFWQKAVWFTPSLC